MFEKEKHEREKLKMCVCFSHPDYSARQIPVLMKESQNKRKLNCYVNDSKFLFKQKVKRATELNSI